MKKVVILNGPNLNLLGKREPHIYGNQTFEEYFNHLTTLFPNVELFYKQTNIEGELINFIHHYGFEFDAIILNAGAYTHTSIAIADAIQAISTPVIEVHITNTYARESFRHHSFISPVSKGIIVGFGMTSYQLAIQSVLYEI